MTNPMADKAWDLSEYSFEFHEFPSEKVFSSLYVSRDGLFSRLMLSDNRVSQALDYVWTKAWVAIHNGDVVGQHSFLTDYRSNTTVSCFTWVRSDHQGKGVARGLWEKTVSTSGFLPTVTYDTASSNGARLVETLRRRYPQFRFIERWRMR